MWIWKHRNACVFEGASPNVNALVQEIRDEANLWCMAGAKGLRHIWQCGVALRSLVEVCCLPG